MRAMILVVLLAFVPGACTRAPAPVTMHQEDKIPARLSDWHLFKVDGDRFRPNDGVLPYDLNTPLFSDYALKFRTVWMPAGEAARYNDDWEFDFPVGTILSKTFHYRYSDADSFQKLDAEASLEPDGSLSIGKHRLVETRLLVRYESGWKALPYVWNESQTDAFLEVAGAQFDFQFSHSGAGMASFTYIVPDMNQCAACHVTDHTSKEIKPLGPKAHQLNRDFSYVTGAANQLGYWVETNRLTGVLQSVPASARWAERDNETIDDLARAYLDVNCAHCHNARGAADTSALILNRGADVDRKFGVCKPPVAVGRGSGDRPYDIYPGNPDESILLYRMQHDDPAIMMPELGRAMVHKEGVAVVRNWIAALPGNC